MVVWEAQRNPELLLAALLPDAGRSFTSSPGLHAELGRGALGSTRRGDIPFLSSEVWYLPTVRLPFAALNCQGPAGIKAMLVLPLSPWALLCCCSCTKRQEMILREGISSDEEKAPDTLQLW